MLGVRLSACSRSCWARAASNSSSSGSRTSLESRASASAAPLLGPLCAASAHLFHTRRRRRLEHCSETFAQFRACHCLRQHLALAGGGRGDEPAQGHGELVVRRGQAGQRGDRLSHGGCLWHTAILASGRPVSGPGARGAAWRWPAPRRAAAGPTFHPLFQPLVARPSARGQSDERRRWRDRPDQVPTPPEPPPPAAPPELPPPPAAPVLPPAAPPELCQAEPSHVAVWSPYEH